MKLLVGVTLILVAGAVALIWWISSSIQTTLLGPTIDIGAILGAAAGLIGAIATLIVAYLIGSYTAKSESKQADNGLLLQILGDVRSAFHDLQQCSFPCHRGRKLTKEEQSKLLMVEKEVGHAIYSFSEAIKHCCKTVDPSLSLEVLKDARQELKASLTDTPYPGPYNESAKQRIALAFRSFRDEVNRLSFVIIRR